MKCMSIDIETFSAESLQKGGVYRYAESQDFGILLFGYSVDGSPVKVVDLELGDELLKIHILKTTEQYSPSPVE